MYMGGEGFRAFPGIKLSDFITLTLSKINGMLKVDHPA
jgi:hypothetical protein